MTNRHESAPVRTLRFVLAAGVMGLCIWFIWSNSMLPPAASSARSEAVLRFLQRTLGEVFGPRSGIMLFLQQYIRKIGHAVEFAVLGGMGMLMLVILGWQSGHTAAHVALMVLMVAVADETIQSFTGRGSSVRDVVLDFAGGLGGMLVMWIIYLIVRTLGRAIRGGTREQAR